MLNKLFEIHQKFTLILVVLIVFKILGFFFIILFKRKPDVIYKDLRQDRIDIIVAAYNEDKIIINTINNLLKIDYSNFEIIIIDDGSTDNTLYLLNLNFKNHEQIKILSKENNGKAKALTYALTFSSAEIVTFIDADTHVQPDILKLVSICFKDAKISAMSGYLKVQNLTNILTFGQDIEYKVSLNLEREIFEKIDTLTTIPGAICAFRKKQLLDLGGFNSETVAEDYNVTLKLLRANLIVKNEKKAIGYTEAPESLRMFVRQRIRWDHGLLQNLLKHSRFLPNTGYKVNLVFTYSWIYKIFYTLLFALSDYLFIILLCFGTKSFDYLIFLIMETILFLVVLKNEIKKLKFKEFLFVLYRIPYRHLKFFSLVMALYIFGTSKKFEWKKIHRLNSEI